MIVFPPMGLRCRRQAQMAVRGKMTSSNQFGKPVVPALAIVKVCFQNTRHEAVRVFT